MPNLHVCLLTSWKLRPKTIYSRGKNAQICLVSSFGARRCSVLHSNRTTKQSESQNHLRQGVNWILNFNAMKILFDFIEANYFASSGQENWPPQINLFFMEGIVRAQYLYVFQERQVKNIWLWYFFNHTPKIYDKLICILHLPSQFWLWTFSMSGGIVLKFALFVNHSFWSGWVGICWLRLISTLMIVN